MLGKGKKRQREKGEGKIRVVREGEIRKRA